MLTFSFAILLYPRVTYKKVPIIVSASMLHLQKAKSLAMSMYHTQVCSLPPVIEENYKIANIID